MNPEKRVRRKGVEVEKEKKGEVAGNTAEEEEESKKAR